MIVIKNDCVDCELRDSHCGSCELHREYEHYVCDNCKEEICDTVYSNDEYEHLCEDCLHGIYLKKEL